MESFNFYIHYAYTYTYIVKYLSLLQLIYASRRVMADRYSIVLHLTFCGNAVLAMITDMQLGVMANALGIAMLLQLVVSQSMVHAGTSFTFPPSGGRGGRFPGSGYISPGARSITSNGHDLIICTRIAL
ncbi:unnamed protein product, partial [Wuchereria bancrofti]